MTARQWWDWLKSWFVRPAALCRKCGEPLAEFAVSCRHCREPRFPVSRLHGEDDVP